MQQQNPVDAPPESRGTTRIRRTPTESCLHLQRETVVEHHSTRFVIGRVCISPICSFLSVFFFLHGYHVCTPFSWLGYLIDNVCRFYSPYLLFTIFHYRKCDAMGCVFVVWHYTATPVDVYLIGPHVVNSPDQPHLYFYPSRIRSPFLC